jgi:hypothetical protein
MNSFLVLLVMCVSLNASSYEKLEKIAELQKTQSKVRTSTLNEHHRVYQLQMESLLMNSALINSVYKTNTLLYYKENLSTKKKVQ